MILHVRLVTGTGGGPDKTVLNSPRFLHGLGYDCRCAYLHPPDDPDFCKLRERARQCDAPLIPVPDRGPFDWKVVQQLIRVCRQHRVAVWHSHDYKSNMLGLLVRRFWPMKLVTTVHGWGVQTGRAPLYNGIDRRCLRFYDHVICVSRDLQEECLRHRVRRDRSCVIQNAIDTDYFRRILSPTDARIALNAPSTGLLLGAMGRLSDEKGFNLLVQAVAQLVRDGHDIHLWIAGEGPCRSALEAEILRNSVGDRVRLLGLVSDPRLFLQATDVFVLSSLREGLPNVVLEAMAMETPVVATGIAGVPNLLRNGELGVLVEPRSVESLTAGIIQLATDAGQRRQLACFSRSSIEKDYSFEKRMQRVAALYDRLLGRATSVSLPQLATA